MISTSSQLKSRWQQPLGSKITRLDFIKKYIPIPEDESVVRWPNDMFTLCDFANDLNIDSVLINIDKFLSHGFISAIKLTGKREAPRKLDSCMILVNKTFEPVYIAKMKNIKTYTIITRELSFIVNHDVAVEIILSIPDITDNVFGLTPFDQILQAPLHAS